MQRKETVCEIANQRDKNTSGGMKLSTLQLSYDHYYTYAEIECFLDLAVQLFPRLAEKISIGKSQENNRDSTQKPGIIQKILKNLPWETDKVVVFFFLI